jgi:hypothetical protein
MESDVSLTRSSVLSLMNTVQSKLTCSRHQNPSSFYDLIQNFTSKWPLPFRVSDSTVAGIPLPSHGCYMLCPSKSSHNHNTSYHAFFPASYLPGYRNVSSQPTNKNMILKGCTKKTRKLMTDMIFECDITLPPFGQPNTLFLTATRNVIGLVYQLLATSGSREFIRNLNLLCFN